MRRFLSATLLMLALMSTSAFANAVHIGYGANAGGGDNFGFITWGSNFFIAGGGGTPTDFFNFDGYAPGSSFGGSTDIFFDGGFARIGRHASEVQFFDPGTLFLSTITFPTNGKDFRAWVSVSFSATGEFLDNAELFSTGGSAEGHIDFEFFNGNYYPATDFVQTPEPSMLALMSTGLTGILALARKRRSIGH